jgi:hypothetical protein
MIARNRISQSRRRRAIVIAKAGSVIDPGRVETPFIPQKLQRMVVVHVDLTV